MRPLRLFWLMTRKNFIVIRRSILWTVLELVLPLCIGIPVSFLMFTSNREYVPLSPASTTDFINSTTQGQGSWGQYYGLSSRHGVDSGEVQRLVGQFCNSTLENRNCTLKTYASPDDLLNELGRDDSHGDYMNTIRRGLIISELDFVAKKLVYDFYMSDSDIHDGLKAVWKGDDPFADIGDSYWVNINNDDLLVQHSLNSAFTKLASGSPLEGIAVEAIKWKLHKQDFMELFGLFNMILAVILMPILVHTGREIATEKENGVKDFLCVMGMNRYVFLSSHVFIGWLKGAVVVTAASIKPAILISSGLGGHVNPIFFIIPIYFYVLAAVVCATMIASIFKTSNSTIKVIAIVHSILMGIFQIPPITPSVYSPGLATVAALNYNGALGYVLLSIKSFLYRNRNLSFNTFFEDSEFFFNVGPSFLMLLFDILWMTLVIIAAEVYYQNTDFSLITWIGQCLKASKVSEGSMDEIRTLENSHEVIKEKEEADIQLERLQKMWGSTGEYAVQDMNLRALRGEVTVLLGHNGAGKSTTFSVICGLTPPTAGRVQVNASRVGFCPQANALFERLTVNEHLWFFHQIKGASNDWECEGDELLEALGMSDKKHTNSMALSGGMKRKLCLSMALIGDSRVVLLDEPTAGMDTGARNDVQRMLNREKMNRTILLTTHYMDEAEALGDRIVIMVRGRDVAAGSPQFLKRRFGTGYVLTIVLEEEHDRTQGDALLEAIQHYVPSATLTRFHGRQVEVTLPVEEQDLFTSLFAFLEENQSDLGVSSFGLSVNNLEQVFLRVGEMAEHSEDGSAARGQMFDKTLDERRTGPSNLPHQLLVLLWKRTLYSLRNWPQWIYQMTVPLIIVFVVAATVNFDNFGNSKGGVSSNRHEITLNNMGSMKFIEVGEGSGTLYENLRKMWGEAENIRVESIAATNYMATIIGMPIRLPPIGCGMVFDGAETPRILANPLSYWAFPSLFQAYANAFLQSNGGGDISMSVRTVKREYHTEQRDRNSYAQVEDYMIAAVVVLVFALLTSPFGIFHVVERVSKFAHQQHLTAVPSAVFYLASVLYDTATFVVMSALVCIAFHIGDWSEGEMGRIILAFCIYFYAILPAVYFLCTFFNSAPKANSLIMIYQTIGAFGAILLIEIITATTKWDPEVLAVIFQLFLPSFGLARGVRYAREIGRQNLGDYDNNDNNDPSDYGGGDDGRDPKARSRYALALILMAVSGTVFLLITIISRMQIVRSALTRFLSRRLPTTDEPEDEFVRRERENVQNCREKYALEVNNLTKNYGRFTAVDRLTFGVREAECFGLLGVNGAGKTTTFSILTGEAFASSGFAKISGKEIRGIVTMGYCPQFDAVLMDLSGREVLWILATLYGYKYPRRKADSILRAVLMERHADKQLKHCSGGQKRKISVGIALLAQTELIILDEPTAGIDPRARREIWSLVSAVREAERCAVLLTSHSMDECEALCTRIAILVRGRMVAIGSGQELKSRFGNSYQLALLFPAEQSPTEERHAAVQTEVGARFPGAVLQSDVIQPNLYKFTVPRLPADRWSSLWDRCQSLAALLGATDCSIAQSTLTQTFLSLSGGAGID